MRSDHLILQSTLLTLLFASMVSCTTTSSQSGDARFAAVDVNKDGKLTKTEARTYLVSELFEARDANCDGQLTAAEWNTANPGSAKRFAQADLDHNGTLSKEEAQAYGRRQHLYEQAFKEADKNKDGFVTREEAREYYASKE